MDLKKIFVQPQMIINAFFILIIFSTSGASGSNMSKLAEGISSHRIAVGGVIHMTHSEFEELPFSYNDYSICIAYEYHEPAAYWQIVTGYTPSPKNEPDLDYVVTPELNLIFKDQMFRLGVGGLQSYLKGKEKSDWLPLYWQILGGLSFEMGDHLGIDIFSFYVFDKWENIVDFAIKDIEYKGLIYYQF